MSAKHVEVTVQSDARQRAMNTLWQGFGVDAVALIGMGLTELLSTADVTSGFFWSALGILVLKSLLTSVATFLVRMKRPVVSDPVPATAADVQLQVGFAAAPAQVVMVNPGPLPAADHVQLPAAAGHVLYA